MDSKFNFIKGNCTCKAIVLVNHHMKYVCYVLYNI